MTAVNILVQRYQETRDDRYFTELVDIFTPLIHSYARRLYYLEWDDCMQELKLALYEAVIKIQKIGNSGMCFSYIENSIRHRFCKLYYDSLSAQDELSKMVTVENSDVFGASGDEYDDCLFHMDLERHLQKMDKKNRQILIMLNQNYSDAEIGAAMGCSKQYINRIKKKLLKDSFREK